MVLLWEQEASRPRSCLCHLRTPGTWPDTWLTLWTSHFKSRVKAWYLTAQRKGVKMTSKGHWHRRAQGRLFPPRTPQSPRPWVRRSLAVTSMSSFPSVHQCPDLFSGLFTLFYFRLLYVKKIEIKRAYLTCNFKSFYDFPSLGEDWHKPRSVSGTQWPQHWRPGGWQHPSAEANAFLRFRHLVAVFPFSPPSLSPLFKEFLTAQEAAVPFCLT